MTNDPSNFHIEQPSQDPSLQDILGDVAAVAPAPPVPTQDKNDLKEVVDLVKEMKEELQKLRHYFNNARVRYDVDSDELRREVHCVKNDVRDVIHMVRDAKLKLFE